MPPWAPTQAMVSCNPMGRPSGTGKAQKADSRGGDGLAPALGTESLIRVALIEIRRGPQARAAARRPLISSALGAISAPRHNRDVGVHKRGALLREPLSDMLEKLQAIGVFST